MNDLLTGRGPRVALYSHDAVGLGHTRRNLAIARALARSLPHPAVLVLSGAPEAAAFPRPAGCDVVGLPALTKGAGGEYTARDLPLRRSEMLGLRARVLAAAVEGFAPDLLVVDKHPRGVAGELEPALRATAARTKVVLGLRDVLDDPATAAAEWRAGGGTAALREFYDAVWVYGDPAVHDPTAALDLPADLAASVCHLGYLGQRPGVDSHPTAHPRAGSGYVLGLCGAGGDGAALAGAFVAQPLPRGTHGVLVAGPRLPATARARLHARAGRRPDMTVLDFVADLTPWLDHADAVVSMAGYNTICEVATRPVPHLVVPRVRPRAEQVIRARALTGAGLLDVLDPGRLSAASLAHWTAHALGLPRPTAKAGVSFDGLSNVGPRTAALLTREETARAANRGRRPRRLRAEDVPAPVGDLRRQRDHRP